MPHQFDEKFYDDISSIGRFGFMSPYIGNGNTLTVPPLYREEVEYIDVVLDGAQQGIIVLLKSI